MTDAIDVSIVESNPINVSLSTPTAINVQFDVVSTLESPFIGLTDVPQSYASQAGKYVKVKSTEDGLEFVSIPLFGRITIDGQGNLAFWASDGITQTAKLDDNGNFWIKGNYLTL